MPTPLPLRRPPRTRPAGGRCRAWLRALALPVAACAAAASLVTGTGALHAQPSGTQAGGIGVRLVDVPKADERDPRAQQYIVDHVVPGATITRRVEVANTTAGTRRIRLYGGDASIRDGAFAPAAGDPGPEGLGSWVTVSPPELELPAGGRRIVTATIRVPADAAPGERYGVVWAELPAVDTGSGVAQVSRAGVRVYLSVGRGRAPVTDFSIEELTARRDADGTPVVSAVVRNTGGRALDLAGEVALADGPGGVSAGPFDAEVGTTVAPGSRAPVQVRLDPELPVGPWRAEITLRSGAVSRSASGTIRFPDAAGASAEPVEARSSDREPDGGGDSALARIAAALLALAALGLLLLWLSRRRRRSHEEEPTRPSEAGES